MRKLLFLLIIFTNVSYASFPVLDSPDIFNFDSAILYDSSHPFFYTFLGVLVGIFSIMLGFLPLLLLFIPNQYFRRGIYIGLIILGLIALLFWINGWGLVIM